MRFVNFILAGTFVGYFSSFFSQSAMAIDNPYFEVPSEKLIKNHADVVKALQYGSYYIDSLNSPSKKPRRVRIGILDNGFSGYIDNKGKRIDKVLPKDTEYIDFNENSSDKSENQDNHGYGLATLVSEMMTDGRQIPELAPKLYLFKTQGYTALKKATEKATELDLDIVLYAQVYEYGGNFDGKGFYNQVITNFLNQSKKTIWINAAGNFGKTVFNFPVIQSDNQSGFVRLPDSEDTLIIKCDPVMYLPKKESCDVKIVLSWNDFKNYPDAGTKKNLDLVLFDDAKATIVSSNLEQVLVKKEEESKGKTLNPREFIQTSLKAGTYYLRVRDSSKNFDPGKDKFRISAYGLGISMPSHDRQENLLTPADNPRVITVGANDDGNNPQGMSSLSVSMNKPNLSVFSEVDLPDSFKSIVSRETLKSGSSAASALIAAKAGLILSRSRMQNLSLEEMLVALKQDGVSASPRVEQEPQQPTVPLSVMKFTPGKDGQKKACFEAVNLAEFRKNFPGVGSMVLEQNPKFSKPFYAYVGPKKIIVLFFMEDPIDAMPGWRDARKDSTTGEDRPQYIPSYDPTLDPQLNSALASNTSPFKLLTRDKILKKNKDRNIKNGIIQFEQFPSSQKECGNSN